MLSHLILVILFFFAVVPLPNPLFDKPYVTTLYGNEGKLLSATIATDEQWRFPESDSIPNKIKIAFQLLEDEYFEFHPGVNPISLMRAFRQNAEAGKVVSGGSTITMQMVRMAMGNQPRTYSQKIIEILAALKTEIIFSKQTILQKYVDNAPFGGNIVGIKAASWRYFGRPPENLSWAETTTLAILPNNPSMIFPGKNQELLVQKRNALLKKISSKGLLDKDELFLAMEEPVPQQWLPFPDIAYHLLHRGIKDGLRGTEIKTTLDSRLQALVKNKVDRYSQRLSLNEIQNAAALVIEIETGETKAYIGNTDNPGDNGSHVDIITSRRSPGSLLKPFLYALALDDGLISPEQLLPDIPLFHKGFAPTNFDKKFRGAIHADDALVSSLNVPFVHLLIDYGFEKFHQKLKEIGFKSLDKPANHYGLSIILGGGETSLWELGNAYSGMYRALTHFTNRPYNSGYSSNDYSENHYLDDNRSAYSDKLNKDGLIRAPSIQFTISAMSKLNRPFEEAGWEMFNSSQAIAWKTGTSYGFRDGWAIGINGKYLVGVWTGNADGEGRPGLTGVSAAAPLMFDLFDLLEGPGITNEIFGFESKICVESGMLASKICPNTKSESMADYLQYTQQCNYHQLINLDQEGDFQVNSRCYPVNQMNVSPWFILPPVQSWYYKKYHPKFKNLPPVRSECNIVDNKPLFDLVYPNKNTKVIVPNEQDGKLGQVIFEAAHENSQSTIYWHLDKEYLGSTTGSHQMGVQPFKGDHILTLIDESGNEIQQRFSVIN
ncbi:MAG: penicillin-binding protein 1C [Bacteroidota bacterium]